MDNTKNNKKRKGRRKGGGRNNTTAKVTDLIGPSLTVMRYSGPIHQISRRPRLETSVQVINFDAAVTTTAGGVYSFAIGAGSSSGTYTLMANGLEWSAFSGQFSDYRVLGVRVSFFPNISGAQPGFVSQVAAGPWYIATDMDDATAPTTYGDLASFNTLSIMPLNTCWSKEISLIGRSGEGDLQPISSAFSKFQSIKAVTANNTASVTIGRLHFWWRVQFVHRE